MPKKILFIEDDPDIFEILNIVFDDEGYEVIGFQHALSHKEIMLIHPDLVLLDVRIIGSDKSGAEICAELKSHESLSAIPVLLLSAERDLENIGKTAGANGVIHKPFGLGELINEINKFL